MFDSTIRGGIELLTCRPLHERGVAHGFTSRRNGFGARNNAREDHSLLARALELDATAAMKQVHGCDVQSITDAEPTLECDAVVTDRPGLGLIVHTADCVPMLVWAETVNAVSAVHAGWRGTLANVGKRAVETLVTHKSASPDELHVAIGPAVRACCFEVGDEVVAAFVAGGRDREVISRPGPQQRRHVDLVEDNRRQLLEAGVRGERIYDSGCCTVCENERFYSYRREGKGVGRLMGVIAVKS
jgi:hypothetical protein